MSSTPAKTVIRCAIYTRKSSDEGLDQEFNSLDAQYEACSAYIASQKHEGWKRLPDRFDDGGISGGTLERPALQRLMAEIDAGRIDMVVVYKIDRLTRALADFVRLVERLDAKGCSFVSVTQAFNTSTSMGRLTLNVLLSFAQFEREVTAERIRDKIAASKKKGLWMGGIAPLGYSPHPDPLRRELVIAESEAETVTRLFHLYATHGCLRLVEEAAQAEGITSKVRSYTSGHRTGGAPLSRGQIHYLLTNPVYRGLIRHKSALHQGLHPAIIDVALWDTVQAKLQLAGSKPRGRKAQCGGQSGVRQGPRAQQGLPAPLIGKLRDETGDHLTPSHTQRHGRRYLYYVSNRLLAGGTDPTGWRLPADALHQVLRRTLSHRFELAAKEHRLLAHPDASRAAAVAAKGMDLAQRCRDAGDPLCFDLIANIALQSGAMEIALSPEPLAGALGIPVGDLASDLMRLTTDLARKRRGVETRLISGQTEPNPDATLLRLLAKAHRWCREMRQGTRLTEIAAREGHSESYIRTRAPLACLSPKIQAAILAGAQPADLSLERIVRSGIPLDWAEQEAKFSF
jgi:DNA invertase Pin-like site-specific DNA recombinase